ncbi:MAG: GTP-binding protein, partial [Candidatus Hodarchaeales archaeon]
GAVGKTALRDRFMGKQFKANYMATIGAGFATKTVEIGNKKQPIKFQIWDLAGQPRFQVVREMYYRGAVGALIVFDITRKETFDHTVAWVDEIWSKCGQSKVPIVLLGNKIDLREAFPEGITPEDGQTLAGKLSNGNFTVPYIETSAKTAENVHRAFTLLGENILDFFKA